MFTVYPLTLSSDAFNALKSDFDQMLRQILLSMESKEAEEGSITVKLGISLMRDQIPDLSISAYDAQRDIIKPKFDHKITSTIQYKSEKSGTLSGNYELVWDKSINEWTMRPIDNGQTSLFDKKEQTANNNDPENDLPDTEPKQLALGAGPARALPPIGALDVDFTEVNDNPDDDYGYEPVAMEGGAE